MRPHSCAGRCVCVDALKALPTSQTRRERVDRTLPPFGTSFFSSRHPRTAHGGLNLSVCVSASIHSQSWHFTNDINVTRRKIEAFRVRVCLRQTPEKSDFTIPLPCHPIPDWWHRFSSPSRWDEESATICPAGVSRMCCTAMMLEWGHIKS